MHKYKVAIIGAGSWGSAVAINLAANGITVLLWARSSEHVAEMQREQVNNRYLPGVKLPEKLTVTNSLADCLNLSEQQIIATPSHSFKEILDKISTPLKSLAWITKGIDPSSNKLLSELVFEKWGADFPVAVISGPSFAKEVARCLPTALVIASNQTHYGQKIINILHNASLRCYLSQDIQGVQICGAVKNVIAIACGISDGLNFGANARAALITRGIVEMQRLGNTFNAKPETFMGLAGAGDLVLTCTDNQSRNRRFGLKLGEGKSAEAAKQEIGQVVEGSQNATQIHVLAKEHGIEMPICHEVYEILNKQISAKESAQRLMQRPMPNDE